MVSRQAHPCRRHDRGDLAALTTHKRQTHHVHHRDSLVRLTAAKPYAPGRICTLRLRPEAGHALSV
jgi:hypothetical protein